MNERFDLETALATWRHQYKYSRAFKGRDLDELEQHLRDQVAFLTNSGYSQEAAFREAVADLGSFHETESNYTSVALMKTRDRRELRHEITFQLSMLTSYFRVAFRNLKKNRVTSIINIVSLSLAIAVTLVTYLMMSAFLTEDYFHENADEIFLVHRITQVDEDGAGVPAAGASLNPARSAESPPPPGTAGFQWWGTVPAPMAPAIADALPDVVRAVRVDLMRGEATMDGEKLPLNISFVDEEFLDMFSFPLDAGSPSAVRQPCEILLSAEEATRLFGREDPIGQSLTIRLGDKPAQEFTVTGVASPFPPS